MRGVWLKELIVYLRGNRSLVEQAVSRHPNLAMPHVEATYLAWIDMRRTGIPEPKGFFENAGVGLSDGKDFQGDGFVRLNFGCSRSTLREALARMECAIEGWDNRSNQ